MSSETTQAPVPLTENTSRGATGKGGGDRLATWSALSLVLGLAGDMAKPIGQYSLWLAIIGLAGFILCFMLRRRPFARRTMFHTGIFSVIMAAIVALQYFTPPEKGAEERGVAAAFVPVIASVQTRVLPLTESQRTLLQFKDAIASGSDGDRVATARELYTATEDSAQQRGMIEAMMQSGNAALRQSAILFRLSERQGNYLSLTPVNRDANDELTRMLLSYSFKISRVNIDSGAVSLWGAAPSNGTVTRQGITMQLYINMPSEGRKLMLVELTPDKDMKLTGTARLDSGAAVAVELPLF